MELTNENGFLTETTREEAEIQYIRYCALLKKHPSEQYKTLKKAYYAIKQGNQIIDIYKALEQAGTFPSGYPRLAIAKAHMQKIQYRSTNWSHAGGFYSPDGIIAQVALPNFGWNRNLSDRETIVPLVPAEHHPNSSLRNYHILWEVEQDGWKPVPVPPGDPLLLKRLSKNLFVVLAMWDLTELEKAVLKSSLL